MADQSVVTTNKFISVLVSFGHGVAQLLRFTVLPVECPTILGMPFLREMNPTIDWVQKVVMFGEGACVSGTRLTTNNMFADLPVDSVESGDSAGVQRQSQHANKGLSTTFHGDGNSGIVGVDGSKVALSVDSLIKLLPGDVIEDCVMVGGVETCVSSLQHASVDKKRVSRLVCPFCRLPHLDDVTAKPCSSHVCKRGTCGKRFSFDKTCCISNPLADHYDLVQSVELSGVSSQ